MKRKILWSVSSLVTFAIGVGAAWIFYYSPSKQPQLEHPPCRSCEAIYASNSTVLPTLTFCDLVSDLERYHNQVVKVRAFVKHDAGYFFLRDDACQNPGGYAQVEFDPSMRACDGAQQVFDDLLGYKHECWKHPAGFDGEAGAVLVGRLENSQFTIGPRFRFIVLCVEEAFPVYPDNLH